MLLTEYVVAIQAGRQPSQPVEGLTGRIIRGKRPEDFETLTDDPSRKLVMIMGSDGLGLLPGKTGYEMLVAIGYEPDYLRHKVEEGNQFKLAIFPEGGPAKLATWDNVVSMVALEYPQVADTLRGHRAALKATPFTNLQDAAGFKFLDVEKVGKSDPRFMTYERFIASSRNLVDARAFLYFTVHLREQFSGDGYTYDDRGNRGMMEYMCPNRKFCDLGSHQIVDLNVQLSNTTRKGATKVTKTSSVQTLPLPPFYKAANAFDPNYQAPVTSLVAQAQAWRKQHNLKPVGGDKKKIFVFDIDDQGDFDFNTGTLFVAGRSGRGAMEALQRRVEFVHRYMGVITGITNTMDSHLPFQIFSAIAHLNRNDEHPGDHTIIPADVYRSEYRPNPAMATQIGVDPGWLQRQFNYYCDQLEKSGKYQLRIWPVHCLIGSPGHRLAGLMEEARLFHAYARGSANLPEIKGGNPLTEHYSIFAPEVMTTWDGRPIPGAQKNTKLIEALMKADLIFGMGEAADFCFATSVADFLGEIQKIDAQLASKFVILRDCTTPVVVPGIYDGTDNAEKAIANFRDAGMKVVNSTDHDQIEELIAAA